MKRLISSACEMLYSRHMDFEAAVSSLDETEDLISLARVYVAIATAASIEEPPTRSMAKKAVDVFWSLLVPDNVEFEANVSEQRDVALALWCQRIDAVTKGRDAFRKDKRALEAMIYVFQVEAKGPISRKVREGLIKHAKQLKDITLDLDEGVRQHFQTGVKYLRGVGVPQDSSKAAYCFSEGAELGHLDSQHKLAWMYFVGQGVVRDIGAAMKLYCTATKNSLQSMTHGDFNEWIHETMLDETIDPKELYKIGSMYLFGWSVRRDETKAFRWLCKAGELGHSSAQHLLGRLYAQGKGVASDVAESRRWYLRAANQGNADAQYELGIASSQGCGVTKDAVEAYKWCNLSAATGHEAAGKLRTDLESGMTQEQVAEAQKLSREFKPRIETDR